MKEYDKKIEEEVKNKKIITSVFINAFISIIFYIGIILLAALTLDKGFVLGTIIVVSTILLLIALFYVFKIGNETGYYECGECHHRFVPKYFPSLMAPHLFTTRYLRCPKCNKKSWAKKVFTK